MANKVESILEEIKGLTLLEAADLVKKMEETFGVSAAAAAPMMMAGGGAAGGAAPVENLPVGLVGPALAVVASAMEPSTATARGAAIIFV